MADDTLCYASDKKSITALLDRLSKLETISGLKLNKDKCNITFKGSLFNESEEISYIPVNKEAINTLGLKLNKRKTNL